MSCHDYCHLLQILVVGFAYSIVSQNDGFRRNLVLINSVYCIVVSVKIALVKLHHFSSFSIHLCTK
jgi:transposase